ncbi:MAG: LamG-like jellyroll fold domain-containing protein, partial [Limisphaerales bacterium]
MKRLLRTLLLLALARAVLPAAFAAPAIFDRTNLVAWCIVPFDSKKRSPAERAEMAAKLGFKHIAYDWRQEHVAEFETEILEYRKRGLNYFAFWSMHEEAFKQFAKHSLHPQIWMTVPSPAGATQAERVEKAAAQLVPAVERANKAGCQFGLYNHGGWGGEPENMVAICELLRTKHGATNVGIIYNQHHGHDHVERFAAALAAMKPYLFCLNLNGMTRDGEKRGQKILPLGSGELDLPLLKIIAASGYRGPIGIIGHTNDDVEQRLRDNLDGFDWLLPQLDGKPAGPKPKYRTLAAVPLTQALSPSGGEGARRAGEGVRASAAVKGQDAPGSISKAFGHALAGSFVEEGKAAYRELPITIELRAQVHSRNGFNILVACDPKSSSQHWELYTYSGSGVFSLYMPGRGGEFKSAANICDGQWHALAAIIESARVRLFVDGKQVLDAPAKPLSGTPHPGGIAFGRLVEGGLGCDGLLDDIRISKGVREITGVPKEPLKSDAQTIGLWNFDDQKTSSAPLTPSLSPSGGEGARRAGEGVRASAAIGGSANTGAPAAKPQLTYTKLPTREATEHAAETATLNQLPAVRLASIHALAAAPTLQPDGSADLSAAKIIFLPNAQWTSLDPAAKAAVLTLHADAEREVSLRIGCKRPVQAKFNNGPMPSDLGPPGWLAGQIGNIADPVPFHVKLRAGDNFLSLTFTETVPFYFELDPLGRDLREQLNARLTADFPPTGEARYWRIETIAVPSGIALEVGGMAFAPDNALIVCTRRGEIWRYYSAAVEAECAKPGLNRAAMLKQAAGASASSVVPPPHLAGYGDRWELFASGLHEPLGLL